ncbi:nucleotidyltransferase [Lacihabitans sp. CCS-44]|uniref:nucleotidyltransferase family protein n=1 Tax=Lacihabitans sp. CCS-44 TaxID=2487331 RepID=UPI0020CD190D|nr:nucleotidyltransferase family protein [Lacihabitans sp. CCS-44]MCP9754982.1 nucleotidyltransferase [Lacihabitans sp. CCS-44]
MKNNLSKNIVHKSTTFKEAISILNELDTLILFIVDNEVLIGTLTDGDLRRGLMKGHSTDSPIENFMNKQFKFLRSSNFEIKEIEDFKRNNIFILPILDSQNRIQQIVDFSKISSILPIDVIIMAGGKGERLKPLTDNCPKPMLHIGPKPILEHNIDRLIKFGIFHIKISINYLGEQIEAYFENGSSKGIEIEYIKEKKAIGTFGAVSMVKNFKFDHVLITNSDLLTNINFEDFFKHYIDLNADLAVASIPYKVSIPYGVLETENNNILSLKEKPTYTFYSNAGIYLVKRKLLDDLIEGNYCNATDFMESLILAGKKVVTYPLIEYWLDIGKHEDFLKAQEDIKHLNL